MDHPYSKKAAGKACWCKDHGPVKLLAQLRVRAVKGCNIDLDDFDDTARLATSVAFGRRSLAG